MKARLTLSGWRVLDFLRWALMICSWLAFGRTSRKSIRRTIN